MEGLLSTGPTPSSLGKVYVLNVHFFNGAMQCRLGFKGEVSGGRVCY